MSTKNGRFVKPGFSPWRGPGPWTRGFVPLAVWPIRREEGGRKRPRPLSIAPPTPAAHGHHRETPANCYFEPLRELPARRRTRCCFTAAFYSLTKVRNCEGRKKGWEKGARLAGWGETEFEADRLCLAAERTELGLVDTDCPARRISSRAARKRRNCDLHRRNCDLHRHNRT